ncbi:MAG: tRNA pseudouridine(38-40) synthase TruA [Planctomycetota bacterium]
MRTLKLILRYDGRAYAGWQRQQPNRPTIQRELESAVLRVTGVPGVVHASGRTDAGVHAIGQVAHLVTPCELPPEQLLRALNANLPQDIAVRQIFEMPEGFHARRHARRKTYFYQFYVDENRNPLCSRRALHLRRWPDLARLRLAAEILTGRHDFRSFVTGAPDDKDTVRQLYRIRVLRTPHGLRIFVTGNGFLRHMVRSLAGLMIRVGTGREEIHRVEEILAARSRSAAPAALPAHALFLWRVDY